jgi:hypothetical protein
VVAKAGFFAFSMLGRDRLISTWFLAAVPHSLILGGWAERTGSYLAGHNHTFAKYLQVHYLFTEVVAAAAGSARFIWEQVPRVYGTADAGDQCCTPVLGASLPALLAQLRLARGRGAGEEETAPTPAAGAGAGAGAEALILPARVPVRALNEGFCAPMSAAVQGMLESNRMPVIKGRAKDGPQGAACSGVFDHTDAEAQPPPGSILAYLIAKLPPVPT